MIWIVAALILTRLFVPILKKKFGSMMPGYIAVGLYFIPAVVLALIIGYWIFQLVGWLGLVVYGVFFFYLIPIMFPDDSND